MILGDASAALAHAFRGCGMKVQADPKKPGTVDLVVDKHPVIVAVKMLTDDERERWRNGIAQAMLRVDVAACARLGIEVGQAVDRWIMRQEAALGALVVAFEGYAPPFPGKRLAHQVLNPDDPWVAHIVPAAKDRFRDSRWLVVGG